MHRQFAGAMLALLLLGGCVGPAVDGTELPPVVLSAADEPESTGSSDAEDAALPQNESAFDLMDYLDTVPDIDPALITDQQLVAGWEYFLYPFEEEPYTDGHQLLRRREDGSETERVSEIRCDRYDVVGDCVYYCDYVMTGYEHGTLYMLEPGIEPCAIAEDLGSYQIVGDYIYYGQYFDTIGVGIERHSLHRMDLDGGGDIITVYETYGPQGAFGGGHLGDIRDGWVYYENNNVRIKLGEPADGTERLELLDPTKEIVSDGWIYYANRILLKSRTDGSEQMVLDDEPTWLYIEGVDAEWIYYHSYASGDWKIRKDGTGKTEWVR